MGTIVEEEKKTIIFQINYWTKPGESIVLIGTGGPLQWEIRDAILLNYKGLGVWQGIIEVSNDVVKLNYKFANVGFDERVLFETGPAREVYVNQFKEGSTILLRDSWISSRSVEIKPRLNASIWTHAIFRRPKENIDDVVPFNYQKYIPADSVCIRFQVHCVFVPQNGSLHIVGNKGFLGNWSPAMAPKMKDASYPVWKVDVYIQKKDFPIEYKYAIVNEVNDVTWEDGVNRSLDLIDHDISFIIIQDSAFHKDIMSKGAGVSIPVFALRSESGFGVGEFNDIKLLSDWASVSGLKLIQILPVNDTSVRGDWRDSYPYNALSVFALHPIYIHLPVLTKDPKILQEIEKEKKELNKLALIDYEAVVKSKLKFLKLIYKSSASKILESNEFLEWKKANSIWLGPYALYCVFKEKYGTHDTSKWKEYSTIKMKDVIRLTSSSSEYYPQISFYYFVQYNLHLQLKEVSEYSSSKGVGIKGDIAIGVSPKSVDTWVFPHLFRLNKSTGAPPDFFSTEGQNWGFPTYNWDEMAKDGYLWWKSRLTHMSQYFHAFRIDHILGFFRIWEIPRNCVTGLLGRFYPSYPVTAYELESRGVWDISRLTSPYIRMHTILNTFGEDFRDIINQYLIQIGEHAFALKPEFNSERKIADHLPIEHTSEDIAKKNKKIRDGLFSFVQNVIFLIDDEDPKKFYPRIELMKTTSFQELDYGQQRIIQDIYYDYYYHRQENLWTKIGLTRLPIMVNTTKMLCCGEDLGMVPACVPKVLAELEILGLRIQRMSDDPKREFNHPADYPYLTVCTPSVHDTSTTRAWWEENLDASQRFYNQILGMYGSVPIHCTEEIMRRIFLQHVYSPSMWSIFSIQDIFGLSLKYFQNIDPKDERINEPSNPEHYWRYRIHISLEKLLQDEKFSLFLLQMMKDCGRA